MKFGLLVSLLHSFHYFRERFSHYGFLECNNFIFCLAPAIKLFVTTIVIRIFISSRILFSILALHSFSDTTDSYMLIRRINDEFFLPLKETFLTLYRMESSFPLPVFNRLHSLIVFQLGTKIIAMLLIASASLYTIDVIYKGKFDLYLLLITVAVFCIFLTLAAGAFCERKGLLIPFIVLEVCTLHIISFEHHLTLHK